MDKGKGNRNRNDNDNDNGNGELIDTAPALHGGVRSCVRIGTRARASEGWTPHPQSLVRCL